jgi:hypothetical protein
MGDALKAMINWQRDTNRPQGWYWDLTQHIPYENTRTLGRFWPGNIEVALQAFFQSCRCDEGTNTVTDDTGTTSEIKYTNITASFNNGVTEKYPVSEEDSGLTKDENGKVSTNYTLDEGIKNNNYNDSRLYRLLKKAMENPDFISFTTDNYDELFLTKIDVAERLI